MVRAMKKNKAKGGGADGTPKRWHLSGDPNEEI